MIDINEPIKIDSEFKSLIPPLSEDEFLQLEENCRKEGIMDSLKTWRGILVDGHNRYQISQKWDLNYEIEEMDFKNRSEAIQWIILNQFGRRNLSKYDRGVLALKLKPVIAEKAKEQQVRKSVSQKSVEQKPIDTQKELAKIADVSHDTIHKVEAIETKGSEPLKQQVRSGEKSINQAFLEIKDKERKQLDMSAKAHLRKAEERHESFQNAKTVSIESVAQDKKDTREIANGKSREIYNAIKGILFIGASNTEYSVLRNLDEQTARRLAGEIDTAIAVLSKIRKEIE